MKVGLNQLTWKISNDICPEDSDLLILDHKLVTDTPQITSNGSILTSSIAPSYQWYLDQQIILNANAQTYKALVNGAYHVLGVQPNCENGLPSNEIDMLYAGVDEFEVSEILIYPNPTKDLIHVKFGKVYKLVNVVLRNDLGQIVLIEQFNEVENVSLDLSSLENNMYLLTVSISELEKSFKVLKD